MSFEDLSNSYREPDPEPAPARWEPSGPEVFLCWDLRDYYGPDPLPDPWVFTTVEAARARVEEFAATTKYDEVRSWEQDRGDLWLGGFSWSVQRVVVSAPLVEGEQG